MTQKQDKPRAKDLAEQLGVIKDDVKRLASMVGDIAADKAKAAKASAAETYADTQDRVRRNPTLAVGVAAGIGFAAARVLLRRRF